MGLVVILENAINASKGFAPAFVLIGEADVEAIFILPFGDVFEELIEEILGFGGFLVGSAAGGDASPVDLIDAVDVDGAFVFAGDLEGEVLAHLDLAGLGDFVAVDLDAKSGRAGLEVEIKVHLAVLEEGHLGGVGIGSDAGLRFRGRFRRLALGGRGGSSAARSEQERGGN